MTGDGHVTGADGHMPGNGHMIGDGHIIGQVYTGRGYHCPQNASEPVVLPSLAQVAWSS